MDVQRSESLWVNTIRSLRNIPNDVLPVLGYVLLVDLVAISQIPSGLVEAFVGLPLALFLPGYAVLSVLFPGGGRQVDSNPRSRDLLPVHGKGLDWFRRVALSFGLTLVLLPPIGLVLGATGLGYGRTVVLGALSLLVVTGVVGGTVRRLNLAEPNRYRIPYRRWTDEVRSSVFGNDSTTSMVLNLLLVGLAVLAVLTLAFAVVASPMGQSYSELYLLSENSEGELVASEYPREFTTDESKSVTIGIENHEGERTTYAVAIELQRVRTSDTSTTVLESERLDRFESALNPGEATNEQRSIRPGLTGEDLRLGVYLYRDDVPAEPRPGNAYRSVFIWVDVAEN